MATGAPGTNGVWQYGEDDSEATFSALLNKAASTTDTQIGADRTRLTALEARKLSGLVPVIPASVAVGSGSGSFNSITGLVTFSGASRISLNSIFSSSYTYYRIIFEVTASTANGSGLFRFRNAGTDLSTTVYGQSQFIYRTNGTTQSNSGGGLTGITFIGTGSYSGQSFTVSADISNPYSATNKSLTSLVNGGDATSNYGSVTGAYCGSASSYDGFSVVTTAGAITGYAKVYGYN